MSEDMEGRPGGPSQAEPVVSALRASVPDARPKLNWLLGTTDESYGTMVWRNRVENLQCHFNIILRYLPDGYPWLRNQVLSAIEQAQQYIDDYAPELIAQGIETHSAETERLSPKGESPVGSADAPLSSGTPTEEQQS